MYFLHEVNPEIELHAQSAKEKLSTLLEGLSPKASAQKISSQLNVFADPKHCGALYLLKDGTLSYMREDKVLFYFDSGDLVGVEQAFLGSAGDVLSDFAVVVDAYDPSDLLRHISESSERLKLWTEYLAHYGAMLSLLAASQIKDEITAPPDIAAFRSGDVIIEQGSKTTDVYTLVEGEAEARVDGVVVGTIQGGEIFGLIAALTGIPRTATVIATKACTVMSLPKENFLHLVKTRPSTFLKVVEDMARTMVELNEQVVSLQLSKF